MQVINCKYVFTPEEEQEIIRQYQLPESLSRIAKNFGIKNRNVIKQVIINHGIKLHTKEQISELNKKHSTEYFLSVYGVANPFQIEEYKTKAKQTKLSKYGDANFRNREKIIQTCTERYGTTNGGWSPAAQEKIKQTNLERYGHEWSMQSNAIRERARQSCLDKYGADSYLKTKAGQQAIEESMLKKYGVRRYAQTEEFHWKSQHKYIYGEEAFDSFPELALYVYCIDHGYNIKRAPIRLCYTYREVEHYYIPDFEINGRLVEIKGDQFFKEDGTMQCPFDHSYDGQAEAKHQCMLNNNVLIIRGSEYKVAVDYFNSKYNKNDYLA